VEDGLQAGRCSDGLRLNVLHCQVLFAGLQQLLLQVCRRMQVLTRRIRTLTLALPSAQTFYFSHCVNSCVSIALKQVMLGNNKATKLLFEKAEPYHIFRYRTLNKSDPFVVQTAAEFL